MKKGILNVIFCFLAFCELDMYPQLEQPKFPKNRKRTGDTKKALVRISQEPCCWWCARQDSNLWPTD
ncbi:hypothetical protein DO021_22560 [Desulfobacter hydrogenophilus]|uniref:Uncharacterized protein n=1 Tax=Desulfobacter hydrogenophilus TaxID=2291 RepID=A0A328F630_9BACT|nr:hypothetical protein DO021_22560 [Desulfobacter hydrogenophilus]